MATVEVELRNYKKANGTQPLVLRVTSGHEVSRKNTGLYIKLAEWDAAKRRVNRKHPEWSRINDALDALCKEAEGVKADIIKDRQLVTPNRVLSSVFATRDFYVAAEKKRNSFDLDQEGSKSTYEKAIARVKAFAGPKLAIEEITTEWLEEFKRWLKNDKGYAHNTIVGTLRKVKAVLQSADLKGPNPFDKVVVGSYRRSTDEPLEMEDIEKIYRYIPRGRWEQIAKDTFLFSFYALGMRSSDVLQLKWSNIKHGRIVYDQNKKVRNLDEPGLSIPLNRYTKEILSRYSKDTDTVFGLVTTFGGTKAAIKDRQKVQSAITKCLTSIALHAHLDKHVNFKLARRSLAHIANQMSNRNVYAIQTALDHKDIKTTEIYLGKDVRAIDELCAVVYGKAG